MKGERGRWQASPLKGKRLAETSRSVCKFFMQHLFSDQAPCRSPAEQGSILSGEQPLLVPKNG